MAGLLPLCKRIDPDRLEERLWLAAAYLAPLFEPRFLNEVEAPVVLAALVARYDRAMAAAIIAPALNHLPGLLVEGFGFSYYQSTIIKALAVYDPRAVTALVRDLPPSARRPPDPRNDSQVASIEAQIRLAAAEALGLSVEERYWKVLDDHLGRPPVPAVALIACEYPFHHQGGTMIVSSASNAAPAAHRAGLPRRPAASPGREVHRQVDPRSARAEGGLDAPRDEASPVPRHGDVSAVRARHGRPARLRVSRGRDRRMANLQDPGVRPARAAGRSGRFAVTWDGVVEPVSSVGPAADLDADIRALADAMRRDRANIAAGKAGRGQRAGAFLDDSWRVGAFGPAGPPGVQVPSALKLCILLRLGRADLAETTVRRGDDLDTRDPGPRPHRLSHQLPDTGPGVGRQMSSPGWWTPTCGPTTRSRWTPPGGCRRS